MIYLNPQTTHRKGNSLHTFGAITHVRGNSEGPGRFMLVKFLRKLPMLDVGPKTGTPFVIFHLEILFFVFFVGKGHLLQ